MTPETVLRDRVITGHTLLEQGRTAEAEHVLLDSLPLLTTVGPHANTFLTLRLLGQSARLGGRLDHARGYYSRALDVAEALGDPDLAAAAVSGMAFVELAADDLPRADEYFRQAVQLVRTLAPGPGRVAVLRNYADLLVRVDDGRAAAFYQEALDQPGIDPAARAAMLVELGREFCRHGRAAAGLERLGAAVALFTEAGADRETYAALVTLAGLARDVSPEIASDAFVRAHDLAFGLHAPIDARHYTEGYAARVRQVEAETERRAVAGQLPSVAPPRLLEASRGLGPDAARTVAVGAPAMIGFRALEEGEALAADLRYAEAAAKFRMAEVMWSALGAGHVLPRVWVGQGRLALCQGDDDAARTLLDRARTQAAALGDARTELAALVGVADLLATAAEPRAAAGELPEDLRLLDVLAQTRALATFLQQGAVPDAAAAVVCTRYRAYDLAERYLREAVVAADADRRAAVALADLAVFLIGRGSVQAASALTAPLTALLDATPAEGGGADVHGTVGGVGKAVVRAAAGGAVARIAAASGEWTDATLDRLRDACAAYDALPAGWGGPGPGAEPPHFTAAEVAVRLGRYAEAAEFVGGAAPDDGTRVVFLPGTCGVYALTAVPGEPVTAEIVSAQPGRPDPVRAAAVVDAAVAVAGAAVPGAAAGAAVTGAAVPGAAVTVVAAGALYGLPLHRDVSGGARPGVALLPSVSLSLPPPVRDAVRTGIVAADPCDDLPFARIAAEYVGARWTTGALCGPAVTAERLAAALTAAASPLVHLACRTVADERRPERSGLVLAGPDGRPDRVDLERLAAMSWGGAVVVLSPGEGGGVPATLVGTLLEAGARAVVANARAVDGLTAAVLTTWLHDELAAVSGTAGVGAAEVDSALATAQRKLRTATGDDLLTWAADHPTLCAEQLAIITERAEHAQPFAADDVDDFATYGPA